MIMKANQMNELLRIEKVEKKKKAKQLSIRINLKKSFDEMNQQFSNQKLMMKCYNIKYTSIRKIDFAYLDKTQHYW